MRDPTPLFAESRRVPAAAAIVALHAAVLVLLLRETVPHQPAPGPVVYADLLFLPAPRPIALPPKPAEPARQAATATRTRPVPPPERIAPVAPSAPTAAAADSIAAAPAATSQPANPADAAQAPPGKIDVGALVAAAGENERRRRKEPLERLQDSQRVRAKDDSDVARAMSKAGRADCTKKYAGGPNLDPLKLIPLLYDTLTDTGCRW
ncbi:hypothetical protein IP92_00071 [Pseudoduganella flava]|uniref:Energy transducer TonB n=1 Tax=Pseudoduganella flava TaxID=871742 RepID=A0A562Q311_9BURK|nr:hypothetical protein [Pseudoduganella flava]QGZ41158.1 hypothetical protein GO485_20270 [Pseudoduganella flava]TWI51089.1 hypothetical protein IP92_00071 [Pseudoduganella flava]